MLSYGTDSVQGKTCITTEITDPDQIACLSFVRINSSSKNLLGGRGFETHGFFYDGVFVTCTVVSFIGVKLIFVCMRACVWDPP